MTSFLRSDRSTAVAIWLFITAALVVAMVVVGGATRLTGSGLSITEWRPVTGVIPPLSDAGWQAEFAKYRQIPQYRLLNEGMGLAGFQQIYWWEWTHRLLGRLVGAVFAIPFVVFLIRGQIPKRLVWRCWAMLGLGALQGAVGWWMVSSGLADRVYVAPERLAIHLWMALILFVLLFWTAMDALAGQPRQESVSPWRTWSWLFLAGVFLQSLLGALVAGNQAGLVYEDWPWMGGRFIPHDYLAKSFWATVAHNQASVQLHHRLGAYVIFGLGILIAVAAARSAHLPAMAKRLGLLIGLTVVIQLILGIATLMSGVPVLLGVFHQIGAVMLLTAATAFAWRVRRV
ncbi:MAG: COX15/CtaA family protein [Parcubacteria group bacterium]